MNKLLLSASLIAIALPGTAYAGEAYVALGGGYVIPENSQNEGEFNAAVSTVGTTHAAIAAGTALAFETEYEDGWHVGGQIGYAFDNGFRVEIDGSYVAYDVTGHSGLTIGNTLIDGLDSSILTRSATPTGRTVGTVLADGTGDVETYGGFLNVLYDIGDGPIQPYLGAGIGLYVIDTDFAPSGLLLTDDSDTTYAYQGIAGINAKLSDNVDLFAEYKYRATLEDANQSVRALPATLGVESTQHLIGAGLRFRFGGAPEVVAPPPPPPPPPPVVRPAPPPPPPPPPPPVARQCNTGPYIVFFDWDKSDITPEAASVLNSAVTAYGDCGTAAIMLAGHADRSGSAQYNVGLSERRNASVTSYLAGRGIPAARISSQAFGESMNRVATADGVRELQNRRVEISYGPGSGR